MKTVLTKLFLLSASLTPMLAAQDITGDWLGTLKTGGPELRMALHVSRNTDGTPAVVLESMDQHASMPASGVTLQDATLKFSIDPAHLSYEGKVSADANAIKGTLTQGEPLPLNFTRSVVRTPKAVSPSDIDGAWSGLLDAGTVKLHLTYHILNTEDGLTGTVDITEQNVKGLGIAVTRDGATVKFEIASVGAVFTGTLNSTKDSVSGTFVQGPATFPLVLALIKDKAQLEPHARPQDPTKPYPYREEDVGYENKAQTVHLAGTLTLPHGKGPFPGVVLITGSGPQDRNEAMFGHRPFLVLADHLTRKGIAVLRVDDRGVGKSAGNLATATTADFATDVEASLAYLKSRPEIDTHKMGLIGHSEGGVIAPMVAARNRDVSFIVMMAGSGVRGDEVLVAQSRAIQISMGITEAVADKNAATERQVLQLALQEKDDTVFAKKLQELLPKANIESAVKQMHSPWWLYFLQYDPAPALRQVKCPVLVLNGSKDVQVPASQNLPAIRQALLAGGNNHVETVEFPGLNHLFQTSTTGAPSEYAQIKETISPAVLNKISSWVLEVCGASSVVPGHSS